MYALALRTFSFSLRVLIFCVASSQKAFKQRLTIVTPRREVFPMLDAAKAADVVVFVSDESGVADNFGLRAVDGIVLQGMPAVLPVVTVR